MANMLCAMIALTLALVSEGWPMLGQQAPSPSAARTLLLPKRIVTGDRATLAVLDVGGRLTPGVAVSFSNGDHLVTDATGRASFAAPLKPGVIYATIVGRPTRAYTTILTPTEAPSGSLQIAAPPEFATLADRFELSGSGFCGEADANSVRVAGRPSLVLAASPAFLTALPPADLQPGAASVEVTCARHAATPLSITFLELTLVADAHPLKPGERRELIVRIRGTDSKIPLEARNLDPKVAELVGGTRTTSYSSGGEANITRFELIGKESGNFAVSIRLSQEPARPAS